MLKKIYQRGQEKLKSDKALGSLLKGSGIVLLIQVLGRSIGYFDQVVLARWMGATEYGFYVYIVSWATLVTLIPQMGQRDAVVRFIPEYKVKQQPRRLLGLVRGSLGLVLLISVGLAIIGTVVAVILASGGKVSNLQTTLMNRVTIYGVGNPNDSDASRTGACRSIMDVLPNTTWSPFNQHASSMDHFNILCISPRLVVMDDSG